MSEATRAGHRRFLNRYYGISRYFYDFTRKYYLLGRDREIRALINEDWETLVEIGPGTGRNLKSLHRARPFSKYGGVEASDEMLAHAKGACPFAEFEHGFAEDAPLAKILGTPPDRIFFSYCLSMVQDPLLALENAVHSLAPEGEVVVVDFADLGAMPSWPARFLRTWLDWFHVTPLEPMLLESCGAHVEFGPGRYYVRARITRRGWKEAQEGPAGASASRATPGAGSQSWPQSAA